MRISARGEYAIRAMLDLALSEGGGLRPIQEIAGRQGIPQRYLEQVLLQLKRAGLLDSKRGSTGGYRLGRPADAITVGAVLRAVEGEPEPLGPGRRPRAAGADGLEDLWQAIAQAVSQVVDGLTLEDLRRRALERAEARRPMYHI